MDNQSKVQQDKQKKIQIIRRIFFFIVGIIIIRLFYFQVSERKRYYEQGENNFLRMEVLDSPRGNLLDCKGKLLATNRPVFDVYWEGSGRRRLLDEQRSVLKQIFSILDLEKNDELFNKVAAAERSGKRIKLAGDISFSMLSRISEQADTISNVVIVQQFKRFYPHASLASHVVGYLGRSPHQKFVGRSGLEKVFHEKLQGRQGHILHIINASGRHLIQKEYKEAEAGNDISLTLDLELQHIAEYVFDRDFSGAFILLDPHNGDIKAMVSYPNFDPNLFLDSISIDVWNEKLAQNSPFLNRATCGLYPPASVFKLVTFAAGLEEGIITTKTQFECNGQLKFYGRDYKCGRRWGHGTISCMQAIASSCNIPCYEIAQQLSIDALADYAFRFGLGRRTKFLLPEYKGLVPTYMWKAVMKGETWWKGETLSSAIGQSYLLVTPLQIARMISSICTGYLPSSRILLDEPIKKEPLNISPKVRIFLKHAMYQTVKSGTSRLLKPLKDFIICAKTGTAQLHSQGKLLSDDKRWWEHGWFGCFFSYKRRKPLVMVILVENTGRSRPALLIAQRFLQEYGRKMKISG